MDCKAELEILLQEEKLAGASLLIFANKQDVPGALTAAQIAEVLGLSGSIGTNRHWNIVSCSAFTGEGLLTGIDWIVDDIASRIFMLE
jgi:ADP-ribosylation factor-like protein 2